MAKLTEDVVTYQLEKVDQGGEVSELFEQQIEYLVRAWNKAGYECEIDEETGEIAFPDGRRAGLTLTAYMEDRDE